MAAKETDDRAASVADPNPTSLDDIEKVGATRFGFEVGRVIMILRPSGRRIQVDLPSNEIEGDDDTTLGMSELERAVLRVVDEKMEIGEKIGFDDLAAKSGYSNCEELREFVRQLAVAGRLRKSNRGWIKLR